MSQRTRASAPGAFAAAAPAIGAVAPDFRSGSTDGEIALGDLRGQVVVLYFYPKDDTPGCTREACAFRDRQGELAVLGAVALGVSQDELTSHEKFKAKYTLNFPLLADPEGLVIAAYGAWKAGKEGQSVERCTFLIDREGILRQVWRNVQVDGHDAVVLDAIRALQLGER